MWKVIKEMFKLVKIERPDINFNEKLQETIDRARAARQLILHSSLPDKDRLQIADEILYLTDDLRELQTLILMGE